MTKELEVTVQRMYKVRCSHCRFSRTALDGHSAWGIAHDHEKTHKEEVSNDQR